MKYILTAITFLLINVSFAKHYIHGAKRVTFRAGPGTDNKIIGMLETDAAVKMVEEGETWSKVVNDEKKEGYVMTRFLTTEVPYSLRYKWLKGHYEKMKEEVATLKAAQSELNQNLGEAKRELASTKENLENTAQSYDELKTGSAEYLTLKEKFDNVNEQLGEAKQNVAILKEKLSLYYFTWFLAGAGVLLMGWLIGFLSKKKKSGYGSAIRL